MFDVPFPLRDVMIYEGVLGSELDQDIPVSGLQARSLAKAIRWDIFGLPGMGKSSICKAALQQARGHFPILVLPEAADYAVKVKGFALVEFEPFLNQVYKQAEEFAHNLATSRSNLVIIREPSIIQNEVYLIVQRGYQSDPRFREVLAEVAYQAEKGLWNLQTAEEVSLLFTEHQERLLDLAQGPWLSAYAILTAGNPITDIDLSIRRQQNADRDPRLMTSNPALLCGYSIGINTCIHKLKERGAHILTLDPEDQVKVLTLKLIQAIAVMRHSISAQHDS